MHLGPHLLQPFLVLHAEMLLLIDDEEGEVAKVHGLSEQGVRPDHDIDVAGLQPLLGLGQLLGRNEPRGLLDTHGEALKALDEVLVVLARQKRGRDHDGYLPA